MAKVRWGIIGPGSIAGEFADALLMSRTGELVAISTRDPSRPGLADRFAGARIIDGYMALLHQSDVDAVYISTPHPSHAEWAIAAARAGKHVLVEKPAGIRAAEVTAMIEAARAAGTFFGEAFMYRLHPMTSAIADLITSGTIGEVRMIQSNLGLQMEEFRHPDHRLYSKELAGGGILDMGCYPVSMARFIAGVAAGRAFADPVSVSGAIHVPAQSGVDEWASATLAFPGGIVAQVSCAVSVALDNVLRIYGATGWLEIPEFWSAGSNRDGSGRGYIHICREDMPRETITTEGPDRMYVHEADALGDAILSGRQQFSSPGMSWDDSLGNAIVLDAWLAAPRV